MVNIEEQERLGGYRRKPLPRHIWLGVFVLVLIFVLSFGFLYYYSFSKKLAASASDSLSQLRAGISDLKNLEALGAEEKFRAAGDTFNPTLGGFLSKLNLFFGSANSAISSLKDISNQGVVIAQEVNFLESNIFYLAFSQGGDRIIASLKNVKLALDKIDAGGNAISSAAEKFNYSAADFTNIYLPLKLNISNAKNSLGSIIHWLDADASHHVLVLFMNPSEIRPGGGFLGSYADVLVNKGNIEGIEIHDINDADRLLDKKIIPPRPLQAIVTNWRAADANWFFDFPDSAKHVISFLESSKLYSGSSTFDGAVAITPRVITDILSLTGPVTLKDSKIILDKDNLLLQLQKEVQVGQSRKVTYPKKVLEEFSAVLLSQIKALDADKKKRLLKIVWDRIQTKDIISYFKDNNLERIVNSYGISGSVSAVPQDIASDYLAVVNANIGGGKSDLYVKQNIYLQSQINPDGTTTDRLTITREHDGNKSSYWWYKVVNIDYLQVFTPFDSHIINSQGGADKKIAAPTNYSKNGYVADDLVRQVESSEEKVFNFPAVSSHNESGKKVFTTWVTTKAGATSKVVIDYTHRLAIAPTDGAKYEFIFNRQSGATGHYKFEISAPNGYKFQENNLPVYDYETDDLSAQAGTPGTLKIDLTLEKI